MFSIEFLGWFGTEKQGFRWSKKGKLKTFQIKAIDSDGKGLNGESEKRRPSTENLILSSYHRIGWKCDLQKVSKASQAL